MKFIKPARAVSRVYLHCSASDDPLLLGKFMVEEITRWHKARHFTYVGYHSLIDKHGMVMPGRALCYTPAAQKGHNAKTIAIMVHGLKDFPPAALEACYALCMEINEAYEGHISFHGHCEVSPKTCPVFDYRGLLRLDRFGRMP